jgi:hypothetical protein
MGNFCFYLAQARLYRGIYGMFMVLHRICALFVVALGFVSGRVATNL